MKSPKKFPNLSLADRLHACESCDEYAKCEGKKIENCKKNGTLTPAI